jgi:hypothetical protein
VRLHSSRLAFGERGEHGVVAGSQYLRSRLKGRNHLPMVLTVDLHELEQIELAARQKPRRKGPGGASSTGERERKFSGRARIRRGF